MQFPFTEAFKYATTNTKEEFWAVWKERPKFIDQLPEIVNADLTKETEKNLFQNDFRGNLIFKLQRKTEVEITLNFTGCNAVWII